MAAILRVKDENGNIIEIPAIKGDKGERGERGLQGLQGIQGIQGEKGDKGEKGEQGPQGEQGIQGEKGADGAKGDKGDTGASGKDGTSVTVSSVTESTVDGGNNVVTFSDGKSLTIKNGSKGEDGKNYVLTDTDMQDIAEMVDGATFIQAPKYVNSVEEMTDTSRVYVLADTGHIWTYKESSSEQEVTEQIDSDYDYPANSRLGSDGSVQTSDSYAGYTCTPFIDLHAHAVPFTLHLDGAAFVPPTQDSYTRLMTYDESQTKISGGQILSTIVDNFLNVSDSDVTQDSEGNTSIVFNTTPTATDGTAVRYIRMSGKIFGTPSTYITYKEEVTTNQWTDTGEVFGGDVKKIAELNNEGTDLTSIKLLPSAVLDFYNAEAYLDNDYSYSHLSRVTYPYRADIPVPFTVKWEYNENAMRTEVAVDIKAIGTLNRFTMLTYNATGLNKLPLYNLLPNKTYYYRVTHIFADGNIEVAKSGSFTTSKEPIRFINIDGTQNVRDLGGWIGLNGKTVKYGTLIRGAALNDAMFIATAKGRRALVDIGILAELNLGSAEISTIINANTTFKKIGYSSYATSITGEAYKTQFKEVLEWIVECLNSSKPIYMHCQGGCDRTGTLVFQLLGLLGVSESDLAKEYELSSFSDVGFGRLRTTTKAVNTYDYVGMVEAIKAYDGATLTDKFYNFAITCGVSVDTIATFRDLMLE